MKNKQHQNLTNQQIKKRSLAEKYFLWLESCEIWCLMCKKTSFNSTLYDCIQPALESSDTFCGLYASDGDCYDVFRSLFWPLIMDYHKVDIRNLIFKHDFGNFNHIQDLSSEIEKQILSINIRINRSIQGYPMIPKLTIDQLLEIEESIRNVVEDLDEYLRGEYHSLKDMNEIDRHNLKEKTILSEKTKYQNVRLNSHWPNGRGLFLNQDENIIIWINEEDHLSFVARSKNGKISEIYGRLIHIIDKMNESLHFQQHHCLGYLNISPLNIGTALEVNIYVKLLHIDNFDQFKEFCNRLNIHVENTNERNIFNLSNTIRLGRTEFHIIRLIWDAVEQIIKNDIYR